MRYGPSGGLELLQSVVLVEGGWTGRFLTASDISLLVVQKVTNPADPVGTWTTQVAVFPFRTPADLLSAHGATTVIGNASRRAELPSGGEVEGGDFVVGYGDPEVIVSPSGSVELQPHAAAVRLGCL